MKRYVAAALVLALACHRTAPINPEPTDVPSGATDVGPGATHVRRPSSSATDAGLPSSGVRAAAVDSGDRRPPSFPADWPFEAGRAAVFGAHAMVAADAPLAGGAGVEILRKGGNAVDAAVAVGFAMAVVYPEAGNIGGGGYMVIRMADGRSAALDYREIAPIAASRNMYLDASGNLTNGSVVGPLASGVPGVVAGLTEALARYGTMPLKDVMAPAIRYAERGFVVDSALAMSFAGNAPLIRRFAGARLFVPGGRPLGVGTRLRQPALAATLRRIAEHGAPGFYSGTTARLIADEMRRDGGIITEPDLARYKAAWREPVKSTYRGYTLLTMPPSSSGGVTVTETLNILEGFTPPHFGSAEWAHLLASAYQRAFVDRNEKLADPAFVAVPLEQLTSKPYAQKLRSTIGADHATPTPVVSQAMRESMETTHYSVADANGNAVATTTTLNALYGSGVYVTGGGFFLNDEMDDFAAAPGTPNMFGLVQGEANAIQAGKRMLSAMSPTIVLDRDGSLLLVVGSRGGPRIITSTSQVILNVLDQHMTLSDAVSAPRIHHQALPDSLMYEDGGLAPAVVDSLQRMGYGVEAIGGVGLINAIMKVRGGFEGMSDPRSSGRPVGY
ncbi:MAG TPA: gamma-glutamyltransferase [Gemmatimonadaceae bacterium]|nr:gamma-glutamyltransferase [Gemmatimonadaceae bacterium]